ncbi:MAG: helix-turn-helix transcriptional regulator, partial [Spirochaetales bacterium]|nr:helix-turn-helix transcriptional regulator [Spirochaetales bacterium]
MKKSLLLFCLIFSFALPCLSAQDEFVLKAERSWCYYLEIIDLTLTIPPEQEDLVSRIELEAEDPIKSLDQYRDSSFLYDIAKGQGEELVWETFYLIPMAETPLRIKARIDMKNGSVLYSNTLEISILPHPHKELDSFVYVHSLTEDWTVERSGNLLIEVFHVDDFKGDFPSLNLPEGTAQVQLEPLDHGTVYLNRLYHRMAPLPYRLTFKQAGDFLILPEEISLTFYNGETKETYEQVLPVIQDRISVSASPSGPIPPVEMTVTTEPETWLKGESVTMVIELVSAGDLTPLSSLLPYGDFPEFLEEEVKPSHYYWEDDQTWEKRVYRYGGTVSRLTGADLGSLMVPADLWGGEGDYFVQDLWRIEGNYHPLALLSFFAVMALTVTGLVLFLFLGIRRGRRNDKGAGKEEKSGLQDIYLFSDEFKLTNRERDVLKVLVDGKSTKEIADVLYISPETAKKHINNIMSKTET